MKALILFIFSLNALALFSPLSNRANKSALSNKSLKEFNGVFFKIIKTKSQSDGWFNKSSDEEVQGVSSNKYYSNFNSDGQEIIVAVIDSGVDVNHEDLKGKIWINSKEIPNNRIDDDGNGFVDDVMGWNFIGASEAFSEFTADEKGQLTLINNLKGQVENDTLEITRELKRLTDLKKVFLENNLYFPKEEEAKLQKYSEEVSAKRTAALDSYNYYKVELDKILKLIEIVKKELRLEEVDLEVLENISYENQTEATAKLIEYYEYYDNPLKSLSDVMGHFDAIANYNYNINYDSRVEIVKDKTNIYGNNNVIGADAFHGTHVSGIIAATRDNGIGINGVAKNVKIMPIRVVPNGDERDKDVANAIIYAVNNGAKVINMSFGKKYSPKSKLVQNAIKYAQEKEVLLVHAAGNENENIDIVDNFPTAFYKNYRASNWIEVGASNEFLINLFANFSNFGSRKVDLFAPGVDIFSTTPNNSYAKADGTSMAAPVVSGVAAIILSQYPKLKANELKDVIVSTGNRYPLIYAYNPNTRESTLFSDLSSSGTIPNVFEAISFLEKNYVEDDQIYLISDK